MTPPKGWVRTTIECLADTRLGKMLDAAKNEGEPTPYLRNVNVRWGKFDLSDLLDMRVTQTERDDLLVRDGDVFMCEGGEPGRCAVWRGGDQNLVFQKAIHRIRPLAGVSPDYIAHHFAHVAANDGLADSLTGTTIKHLPQVALQRSAVVLPPLAEQHRIVAKLDALITRLTRARAELDRVPVLAKRFRDEALRAAFEGELVEGGTTGWTNVPFSRLGEIASNLVDPSMIGELPHIAPNHIASARPALLPYATIGEDGVTSAKHRFFAGQILYSKIRPYLRKAALVDFDGGCSADMYPINALCHARYLLYWMISPQFTWLATRHEGRTVLPKINQTALNAIASPCPPAQTQAKIAAALDTAFARADRLEAEAARARALLDRLDAAFLAKAFRGELVPQDPNDEPASVLLDRIRAERAAAPKVKRRREAKGDSADA